MALEIINKINWVDLVAIIIIFRICYVSLKSGFSAEIFKLLGTTASAYLSLHYFTLFSDWLVSHLNIKIGAKFMPLEFMDFVCFVILAVLGYLVFIGLRLAFYRFVKMQAVPRLNKWGGLVLGITRAYLLASLIVIGLAISTIPYLRDSAVDSYSGRRLFKAAPAAYSWMWNKVFSKFMSREEFNKTIFEVSRDLPALP